MKWVRFTAACTINRGDGKPFYVAANQVVAVDASFTHPLAVPAETPVIP
jgi:hypothetical protein